MTLSPCSSASRHGSPVVLLALLALLCVLPTIAFGWELPNGARYQHNGPADEGLYVLKKSEQPQWEDLGWAWGKRSAPEAPDQTAKWEDLGWAWGKRSPGAAPRRARASGDPLLSLSANRVLRSMTKQSPDWHDLGWAWGKRK